MPAFSYAAVDALGRRTRGRLEVGTSDDVRRRLTERGLLLVSCEPVESSSTIGAIRVSGSGRRSLVETTRAIASLLSAGMPLTRVLETSRAVARGQLAVALDVVRSRVERGESLAAALAEQSDVFDPFYVGAVRAGERGSDLPAAFARLADHIERQESVRERLISASIYPLILAAVGGTALMVLLLFVVPRFVTLIEDTGAAIPAATAVLLGVSNLVRAYWAILLISALTLPTGFAALRGWPDGRRLMDGALLRLPLVGRLRREVLGARFARLLAVLLRGGAPLLQALDSVAGSIADSRAADEVTRVRARTREGQPLHVVLAESVLFPELLARLVAVGEESGRLSDFLERAALMLEDHAQRSIERMVTLLEPAMIVAFGGIVALVALSLLQAVYGLNAGGLR